jgi:hypothetical protein
MINKEYLLSFYTITVIFVLFSLDNETFAQNEFFNETSSDTSFANTIPDYDEGSNVEYYDYNNNSLAFDESMNRMDDFFRGNMDNYQQPFNEENDILTDFGESLSNSIFNDTSIFGVIGYSLIDNVKVVGAQAMNNNSIKVTLGYNNNNSFSTSPSVTIVAYKLDINISDFSSFLSSAVAGSQDMMMMIPSSQLSQFDNNIPIFDMISNFKIGSNIAESGWSSPHDVTIKVRNGGFTQQSESDTSIILIELIPQE